MITHPSPLQNNDLIVIVSPSGVVNQAKVLEGIEVLKAQGFQVESAPHVFSQHFKFAGTHKERLTDLQDALDHPKAKAILCARGGFGITHIIDQLNWSGFKKHPKWIIGFSDITALLHAAFHNGYVSLHASVAQGIYKLSPKYQEIFINNLRGDLTPLKAESNFNKSGTAEGTLIGGNLSLLAHQIGTETELDYTGKILFIEEVGEPLYHIDRMLLQLKRANKLKGLAGLVVGQFTNMKETKELFGQSVEEIILAHCEAYNFPIAFNFPFGHGEDNCSLLHGATMQLIVKRISAKLTFLPYLGSGLRQPLNS